MTYRTKKRAYRSIRADPNRRALRVVRATRCGKVIGYSIVAINQRALNIIV